MIPAICIGGYSNERIKNISDAGFKAVEINFSEIALKTEAQISEYIDYINSIGMYPIAGNCFIPWTLKNENGFFQPTFDIGEFREYVDMAFEKTAKLKLESIALGSGAFRRMPDGYEKQKALDIFGNIINSIIVPKLDKYDTFLSVEELNAAETNFLNNCTETAELVRSINNKRVGLLCDYFHMSMEYETDADVHVFADTITHLHIASAMNKRTVPLDNDGEHEKYSAFLSALKKCGYKGKYLSVEGQLADEANDKEVFSKCYSYLKKLTSDF